MSDLKIQGEVVVDASGATSAFDQVADKAGAMATKVQGDADRAGRAIDGIGQTANDSAEKFTRAEARMRASIQRSTEQLQLLGKTASEKLEFQIQAKGLDASKLAPYVEELKRVEAAQNMAVNGLGKMEVSAAQTAAAMRQLPAQFTDIVTSLQGGQAPLTVLLQQGGQIKDSFGGVGAAIQAVGGYVLGLVNPFTLAAAAAGVAYVAFDSGDKTMASLKSTMLETRGAITATTSDLINMANALASDGFTRNAAADAIGAIASNTVVANAGLQQFTKYALELERYAGRSIKTTVKELEALTDEPSKTARSMGLLTAAEYELIKGLEDTNHKSEAARIALRSYGEQAENTIRGYKANLSGLDKVLEFYTKAGKDLWNALTGAGMDQSAEQRIAALKDRIANLSNPNSATPLKGANLSDIVSYSVDPDGTRQRLLENAQAQLKYLEQVNAQTKKNAEYEAAWQEQQKAAKLAIDEVTKTQDKGLTKTQQMNKALQEYAERIATIRKANPGSELVTPAAVARGESAIRDQFKVTPKEGFIEGRDAAKAYADAIEKAHKLTDEATGKTEHLNAAQLQLKTLMADPVWGKMPQQWRDIIQAELGAASSAIETQKARKLESDATIAASKAHEQYLGTLAAGRDKAQADQQAQEEQNARLGLSAVAVAQLDAAKLELLATEKELLAIKAIDRNQDQAAYDLLKEQAKAYRELASAKVAGAYKREAVDAAKAAADEGKRMAADLERALTDSLMRGFESGKGFAQSLRDGVVNMFKTMVLRPVISAIVNPVVGTITSALGLTGTANAAGGALGTVSNAASLYNAASGVSSFASTAAGWAGSGIGALTGSGVIGGNAATAALITGDAASAAAAAAAAAEAAGTASAAAASAATTGASAASSFLAAAPYAAAALAVIALASSMDTSGTYHTGSSAQYDAATGLQTSVKHGAFGTGFGGVDYSAETEKFTSGVAQTVVKILDGTATAFGKTAGYTAATAFADDTSSDGAWGALLIKKMGNTILNWDDTRTSRWAPKEFADGAAGKAEYLKEVAAGIRTALDDIGLPDWAKTMIDQLPASSGLEELSAVVDKINTAKTALEQLGDYMPDLAHITDSAASKMMAAFGGVDAFAKSMGSYLGNFYSTAEQKAINAQNVAEALNKSGLNISADQVKGASRADYRAFVEEVMRTFGSDSAQYVAAINQSSAFAAYTDTPDQAAQAAAEAAKQAADAAAQAAETARQKWQSITDNLLSQGVSLQVELLTAQGHKEAALAYERENAIKGMDAYQVSLYDSNAAIKAQITALEDAKTAREKEAEAVKGFWSTVDSVVEKFLSGSALDQFRADRIVSQLGGYGISMTSSQVLGASIADVQAFGAAVTKAGTLSTDAKTAILQLAAGLIDTKQAAIDAEKERLLNAAENTYGVVERAINLQRDVVQETIDNAKSVFDTLKTNVRDLRASVADTSAGQAQQGRDFIAQALATARATGYLPDNKDLADAISAARNGLDQTTYATQAEADYQRLVLAGELQDLQDLSGDQLTEAQQQLKTLNSQLDVAKNQLDTLKGIDTRVLSVSDALREYATAVTAAMGMLTTKTGATGAAGAAGALANATNAAANISTSSSGSSYNSSSDLLSWTGASGTQLAWGTDIRAAAQALVEAGNAKAVYDAVASSGFTLAQADKFLQVPTGTAEDWARSMGLPVFHQGTDYVPRTGLALLQQGEAVVPRQLNPAYTGQPVAGQDELIAEIRALRAEVQRLQQLQEEGNDHAYVTSQLIDKSTEGGNAMRTVAMT